MESLKIIVIILFLIILVYFGICFCGKEKDVCLSNADCSNNSVCKHGKCLLEKDIQPPTNLIVEWVRGITKIEIINIIRLYFNFS